MSVNGITGSNQMSSVSKTYQAKKTGDTAAVKSGESSMTASEALASAFNGTSAVYESSAESSDKTAATTEKAVKGPNTDLINKLKAETEARTQQLQNIVNQLISKQGITYNHANGLKGIFEALEVDEATRKQAQEDIGEDGYFGVEQTSSRIFDFAMALSGGDKATMEKMKDVFLKGYKQAEGAWGDKLPEICQKTYDAVLKKFEDYANSEE